MSSSIATPPRPSLRRVPSKEELAVFERTASSRSGVGRNAFSNRTPGTCCRMTMWILCGVILVPLRFALLLFFGILAALISLLGTWGLKETKRPLATWRRVILCPVRPLLRVWLVSWGVWVSRKGKPAPRTAAPFVICNHTSFLDPIVLVALLDVSPVAERSVITVNPILASIAFALQALLVDRERPTVKAQSPEAAKAAEAVSSAGDAAAVAAAAEEGGERGGGGGGGLGGGSKRKGKGKSQVVAPPASKQKVVTAADKGSPSSSSSAPPSSPQSTPSSARQELWDRAHNDAMPATLIFPEGTTTNGLAIISFKTGAFIGVPIQPVTCTYACADTLNDPSWVNNGPSQAMLLLRLMATPFTLVRLTFLPAYTPSEAEKARPELFAKNMQLTIARAMDVLASRHALEDIKLMSAATLASHYPIEAALVEWESLRDSLDLRELWNDDHARDYLRSFIEVDKEQKGRIGFEDFKRLLTHSSTERKHGVGSAWGPHPISNDLFLHRLFDLMDVKHEGSLDFRDFLVGMAVINNHGLEKKKDALKLAFKLLDVKGLGRLDKEDFSRALIIIVPGLTQEHLDDMFRIADQDGDGCLSSDEFFAWAEKHADQEGLFRGALFGFTDESALLSSVPPPPKKNGGGERSSIASKN